ncbi:MAG TPA: site-specific integrase [Acidimicrobiales bacterium]|nr:site-specific integrase [Acidimicrobiales bacterium]
MPEPTIRSFLTETWLPATRTTVRATTFSSYCDTAKVYLVPAFGHLALSELTPPAINAFYGECLTGWSGRAPISPSSVRRLHNVLRRALRDAVRWGLLERNPAAAADPPQSRRTEMRAWTPAEGRRFLDAVVDDRRYPLWLFYLSTGARRGEALALRWGDVDLERGFVRIHRAWVPAGHVPILTEPKTSRGRRTVAIDRRMVEVLDAHRGAATPDPDALVFCRADGRPLHPEAVTRWFAEAVRAAGVPRIRLHDTRHTHASWALASGVDTRIVSARLGHATAAFTADVYQHLLPGMDGEAAQRIADLLYGRDPDGSACRTV